MPIVGRAESAVISVSNLNLPLKFKRVSALVILVSVNKNAAQSVPISDIAAAKKKGACGLILLNTPPIKGPITYPKAKDEPKIPNLFALFLAAWRYQIPWLVLPIRCRRLIRLSIRAAKSIHKTRASAKSKNEIQVPARLMTNNGLSPHLSESEP